MTTARRGADPKAEREKRLAEALKANLKRRKAQQRERAAATSSDRRKDDDQGT